MENPSLRKKMKQPSWKVYHILNKDFYDLNPLKKMCVKWDMPPFGVSCNLKNCPRDREPHGVVREIRGVVSPDGYTTVPRTVSPTSAPQDAVGAFQWSDRIGLFSPLVVDPVI